MVPLPGSSKLTYASGDRDETCAKYGACLTAHLAAYAGRHNGGAEKPASCPKDHRVSGKVVGCRWREAAEPTRATEYLMARE